MRLIAIMILCLLFCGCEWKSRAQTDSKEKTKAHKAQVVTGTHSAKISRERDLPGAGAPAIPASVQGGPDGFVLDVLPGMDIEIKSQRETELEESTARDATTSMVETALNLPWGVYVAVIALVAGGALVIFKVGPTYGVPMVLSGIFLYAVFVTFGQYPHIAAWGVGLAAVLGVAYAVYHFSNHETTKSAHEAKERALAVLKRAVDNLTPHSKEEVKAKIKSMLGDGSNPKRKEFDNEIESV